MLVNPHLDPQAVTSPTTAAAGFHEALPGYALTPVRQLGGVLVKDESERLGLPAFKILGASWAVERALAEAPATTMLVAASAGNHGRAVAREAARRGLACRVFLPERSLAVRREAIAAEGARVEVVRGTYEQCVELAGHEAERPDTLAIADVGDSGPAHDVIDGYATLFGEAARQAEFDLIVVPVGVGSLAAAAARFSARAGIAVVGAEPVTAACLTASLAAGEPTAVDTPGTTMAGLDCAEVSSAAWPDLRAGIAGTVVVSDDQAAEAQRELAASGLYIGESGAAPLAALRLMAQDPAAAPLREATGLGVATRVLVVATEGRTGEPPPG